MQPTCSILVRRATGVALTLVALLVVAGCSNEPVADPPACVEGRSVSCTCADGSSGAQICRADGTYAACTCEVAATDAGPSEQSDLSSPNVDAGAPDTAEEPDAGVVPDDAGPDTGSDDCARPD
ncbi:MAG: hypothetical protein R3324_22145, partial [Halobacteriales archaeon]|nr:hypothetical protein [Halobacteriales archaeon]